MESIAGVSAGYLSANAAPEPDTENTLGQDAFLKLLVAQLRYQDPTNPVDSQQFMAQTAQFTSLEKLEEIADAMTAMTQSDNIATISNLVGKTIQTTDSLGEIIEATVTAGRLDDGVVLVTDGGDVRIDDVIGVVAT